MFPKDGEVVVPHFEPRSDDSLTIEHVRAHGVIVAKTPDGTRATVEIAEGSFVSFCSVTLNADGTIADFAPRTTGTSTFAGTFTTLPK